MLRKALRCYKGVKCFRDEISIESGEDITEKVKLGIEDCTHLVIIVSKEALQSNWVNFEIGYAQGKNKEVISYYTDELKKSDLPNYITRLKTIASAASLLSYFTNLAKLANT